jgi:hypothetical protein
MNRFSKNISCSHRPEIDTLKNRFRFAKNPFDGCGYPFKQAIKELRNEGTPIIYDNVNCRYYNKNTVLKTWNYN